MLDIPFNELKQVFNSGIDAILSQQGLTIPVTLIYSNNNQNYCNNCVFDPVTNRSSNSYNNSGPKPFPENSVCPVCLGMGSVPSELKEVVHMAVIFDSKYWVNINPVSDPNNYSQIINVGDVAVQTICKSILIPKINNANEIYFNNHTERYFRAGDPTPVGLGDTNYIFTMWKRK